MVSKYFGGILPEPQAHLEKEDNELRDLAEKVVAEYRMKMENIEMHTAMSSVWSLISGLNKYIDHTAPWNLAKQDKERLSTVIYYIMEGLRYVGEMIFPVMPNTSAKILEILGISGDVTIQNLDAFGKLNPGLKIVPQKALFPRVERLTPSEQKAEEKLEDKNLIDIAEFAKVELTVGKIVEASKVEKSEKLVLLKVDVGRIIQIAAGIAQSYTPEELTGKYIAVVTNLKPAKLMGIASEGMLLATDATEGKLSLLTFDKTPKAGSRIR